MNGFIYLAFQCYLIIQASQVIIADEIVVDPRLGEKICHSFNERKCPFDDYCFAGYDDKACLYCPSGGEKDVCDGSWYANNGKGYYEKCPTNEKYYSKEYFAYTWRNNCFMSNSNSNTNFTKFDDNLNIFLLLKFAIFLFLITIFEYDTF